MKDAIKSLKEAMFTENKDAAIAALSDVVIGWADLQERQAAAMERVAAALENQTKMLEKAVNPLKEVSG